MKALKTISAVLAGLILSSTALAGEAETSAGAGTRLFRGGTAEASARYEGKVGFARSETHTGKINAAKGVAVGVDRDGLSISVSTAVAPKLGKAVAANFNMTIGRDGEVSKSTGLAIAKGPLVREVRAGGETSAGRFGTGAASEASGKAPLGHVRVVTRSRSK
ncbi:MAG: hypothetical protein HZB38_17950 [Planctomycetes bacterium]|nr:hypothetical protein [Planctomycetota bacterium]